MTKVQCLDDTEEMYLINKHGWIDIDIRHMISADEDETNMTVSLKIEELEKALNEFKKGIE